MHRVNMKDARRLLPKLVEQLQQGAAVEITRRGKKVAVIVPPDADNARTLPSLADFRASIHPKGTPLSELIRRERNAR